MSQENKKHDKEDRETKQQDVLKNRQVNRRKRVALGVPRRRLAAEKRPGYVRRWVNDKDQRISRALEGGYNFVGKDGSDFEDVDATNYNQGISNAISKVVNSDGTKAYLMEITQEWYDEDQREKQKLVDATEEALRRGEDSHGRPGADGRYIPKEGIKITHG